MLNTIKNENRLFCCCFLHFTNFGKIWKQFGKNLEKIWKKFGKNLEKIWKKFGKNLEKSKENKSALFNGKWSLDQISVDRKFFHFLDS